MKKQLCRSARCVREACQYVRVSSGVFSRSKHQCESLSARSRTEQSRKEMCQSDTPVPKSELCRKSQLELLIGLVSGLIRDQYDMRLDQAAYLAATRPFRLFGTRSHFATNRPNVHQTRVKLNRAAFDQHKQRTQRYSKWITLTINTRPPTIPSIIPVSMQNGDSLAGSMGEYWSMNDEWIQLTVSTSIHGHRREASLHPASP